MPRYPFLSDEWVVEARALHERHRGAVDARALPLRANLVVLEVPFGEGTLHAHVDTTSGELELDTGHLDEVDATVTLEWATARALFVEGDAQVLMQAFMGGRIRVDGDLAKLLALQTALPPGGAVPDAAVAAHGSLRDITA